jgi:hypothetical protein
MAQNLQPLSSLADPAEINELLGPPPILSSERRKAFDSIQARFVEAIKPKDFIEMMLIRDLTIHTWDLMRYSRHKALAIERKYKEFAAIEDSRKKAEQQRKEAWAARGHEQPGKPTTEIDRLFDLEVAVEDSVNDIDAIVAQRPEELQYAKALEAGIEYYERLDRLMSVATRRRDETLQQIDMYRHGLGAQLRRVSNEIIEGDFEQKADETRIVPSMEQGQ